jgi:hypothetical protein
MEVIFSTGLGILGAIISTPTIGMVRMEDIPITLSTEIMEEETMALSITLVLTWLELVLICLRRLCRGWWRL